MDKIIKTFALATEEDYEEGMNWYPSAYKFARSLSDDVRKAAGVIAALSPHQRWEQNMKSAEKIMKAAKEYRSVIPKVGGTYINADKAWRIAHGEDPEDVLKSTDPNRYYKVRRFFDNILGNQELVTVDTWTAIAAMDIPPRDVRGQFYLDIERRFQKIANRLKIPPRELQAICWVVARKNGIQET